MTRTPRTSREVAAAANIASLRHDDDATDGPLVIPDGGGSVDDVAKPAIVVNGDDNEVDKEAFAIAAANS